MTLADESRAAYRRIGLPATAPRDSVVTRTRAYVQRWRVPTAKKQGITDPLYLDPNRLDHGVGR